MYHLFEVRVIDEAEGGELVLIHAVDAKHIETAISVLKGSITPIMELFAIVLQEPAQFIL